MFESSPKLQLNIKPHSELFSLLMEVHGIQSAEEYLKQGVRRCRNAVRTCSRFEEVSGSRAKEFLKQEFIEHLKGEAMSLSDTAIEVLDNALSARESLELLTRVNLLRIKGDIHRYLFEITGERRDRDNALQAYNESLLLADISLRPTEVAYMNLVCSMTSLLKSDPKNHRLAGTCKHCFQTALSLLDPFDKDSYQQTTAFLQLIRTNLVGGYHS
uniref:14-3-3 domain-containing protein n=1 Tax=Paramoeba aestuarina TaxID=180227 RepID=A0A7S4ULF8_9EUKA|mmetsp:Transcript_38730/g.61358  ORF Transcript_38730/g.61358 Transcript_38730/m.61358 type:complete len:215 (+) Transcript_38730:19-663(+)